MLIIYIKVLSTRRPATWKEKAKGVRKCLRSIFIIHLKRFLTKTSHLRPHVLKGCWTSDNWLASTILTASDEDSLPPHQIHNPSSKLICQEIKYIITKATLLSRADPLSELGCLEYECLECGCFLHTYIIMIVVLSLSKSTTDNFIGSRPRVSHKKQTNNICHKLLTTSRSSFRPETEVVYHLRILNIIFSDALENNIHKKALIRDVLSLGSS
jgi:hypothetical protein